MMLLFSIVEVSFSQFISTTYYLYTDKADSLFRRKEFKESAINYSKAFILNENASLLNDRYNAARSWCLAGVPDSALIQLEFIASLDIYTDYNKLISDSNFILLHNNERWKIIVDKIKENKRKLEKNYDFDLINIIDSIKFIDQKWRNLSTNYNNNLIQKDSIQECQINDSIRKTDSLNTQVIRFIINKYGYPNYDKVGVNSSHNFWLIVQHQDRYPELQDSILKLMKIEIDKGKASASDYAYLIDRVKVNNGQLQIYGTQMTLNIDKSSYEPRPLIEPDKLNDRRKSMGLPTIEEYIQIMNNRYFGTLQKKQN